MAAGGLRDREDTGDSGRGSDLGADQGSPEFL